MAKTEVEKLITDLDKILTNSDMLLAFIEVALKSKCFNIKELFAKMLFMTKLENGDKLEEVLKEIAKKQDYDGMLQSQTQTTTWPKSNPSWIGITTDQTDWTVSSTSTIDPISVAGSTWTSTINPTDWVDKITAVYNSSKTETETETKK